MQLFSDAPRATCAGQLADFLLAHGCSFRSSDSRQLRESVLVALNKVLFAITPDLKNDLRPLASRSAAPVREAFAQAVPLLGMCTGVEERPHLFFQAVVSAAVHITNIVDDGRLFRWAPAHLGAPHRQ